MQACYLRNNIGQKLGGPSSGSWEGVTMFLHKRQISQKTTKFPSLCLLLASTDQQKRSQRQPRDTERHYLAAASRLTNLPVSRNHRDSSGRALGATTLRHVLLPYLLAVKWRGQSPRLRTEKETTRAVQQQKRLMQTSPAARVAESESRCRRLNCTRKQGQATFGIAPEILIKTCVAQCEGNQKVGG